MAISYNPGRQVPDPVDSLLTDPFVLMIESQGRDVLGARYDYIADLLEQEFEAHYLQFFKDSSLHYEVLSLISLCTKPMRDFGFPRRPANASLRRAITSIINSYLLPGGRMA